MKTTCRLSVAALLVACGLALLPTPAAATTITIINEDGAGEGFNDPTPAAPVGGNPGTTVGQQRLNAFTFAASIWEGILASTVEIRIGAKFNPLDCTANSGVLGSAGPNSIHRDYPGAPLTATWYVDAEADMHSGFDRNPGAKDINATFNSNLGTTGCLESSAWYYGLDENEPAGEINLVVVLLHEFSHGLGFLSLVDETTGQLISGTMDVYSRFLFDTTTGLHWDEMSNTQRAASAINTDNLVWDGPAVTNAAPQVLCAPTVTEILPPSAIAGSYNSPLAAFTPDCSSTVTGDVVLVDDGTSPTADACSATAQDLTGRIALVDRGGCAFITKVLNAQNAGAIGVIVANNVAGDPFAMGGSGAGITIPAVMVSQSDGNLLKGQVGAGLTATIGPDPASLAGADGSNRVRLYNPNPIEGGSSISHWTTDAQPNLLMEPAINSDLPVDVDLTVQLFSDIGWEFNAVSAVPLPVLAANRLSEGILVRWELQPELAGYQIQVHRAEPTTARVQISTVPLAWNTLSFLDTTAPDGPVSYWLELIPSDGPSIWQGPLAVAGNGALARFSFAPGFPNPFRVETRLSYTLPVSGNVRVTVHDLRGRRVRELVNTSEAAGDHTVFWDGKDQAGARVAAGIYYARVQHQGQTRSQKIVSLK